MATFNVTWEMEVQAESVGDAAEFALAEMRDEHSEAVAFNVVEMATGESQFIDLKSDYDKGTDYGLRVEKKDLEETIEDLEELIKVLHERLADAEDELRALKDDQDEELRRDEKNGLYPDQDDIAN